MTPERDSSPESTDMDQISVFAEPSSSRPSRGEGPVVAEAKAERESSNMQRLFHDLEESVSAGGLTGLLLFICLCRGATSRNYKETSVNGD